MQRTGVERKNWSKKKKIMTSNGTRLLSLWNNLRYVCCCCCCFFSCFFFNLISCNVKMIKTNCKETSFSATISNLASYLCICIRFILCSPNQSNQTQLNRKIVVPYGCFSIPSKYSRRQHFIPNNLSLILS